MKTNYTIKNFRVFGEDGVTINFAPLTILTGCNSSGKSSVAKSLLLLDTYLHHLKIDINANNPLLLNSYSLDFHEYPLNLLGRFDKVINKQAHSHEMTFRYTNKGMTVEMVFNPKDVDAMNRGYLKSLTISNDKGVIYSTMRGAAFLNLSNLIQDYLEHVRAVLTPDGSFPFGHIEAEEYSAETRVSLRAINWAEENKSFFKIPVLEKLNAFNKEIFYQEIEKLLSQVGNEDMGLRIFLKRLSEVYLQSETTNFDEFFRLRAMEWMSNLSNISEEETENVPQVPANWAHVFMSPTYTDEAWQKVMTQLAEGEAKRIHQLEHTTIKFPWLLTTLVNLGRILGLGDDKAFCELTAFDEFDYVFSSKVHKTIFHLWEDFVKYATGQLKKVLSPEWSGSMDYVGSSRVDVKRIYPIDDKSNFSKLLHHYFDVRRDFLSLPQYKDEKGYEADAFLNRWCRKFGIADKIALRMDSEGLGVVVELIKDGDISLLADEGYGMTQLFSVLLQIEAAIQDSFRSFMVQGWFGQNYIYTTDMNTGKVLFPEQTIIIEEPEIHLHPNYQSLLAEMFVEAMEKYNIHFIIETHSEYLIRRLQVMVAKGLVKSSDVSVIYVEDKGKLFNMGIKDDGKFTNDFGTGFFDEADNAAIQLFELNNE